MTLDPGQEPGQGTSPAGAGERLDAFLMGPFLKAKGAVNCDIMARRLSKRNLLALRSAMVDGADLISDILGLEKIRETAE